MGRLALLKFTSSLLTYMYGLPELKKTRCYAAVESEKLWHHQVVYKKASRNIGPFKIVLL